MVKEDIYGGFGKDNERTAVEWCKKHAKEHDNSTELAEECASVFDFYLDKHDYKIPEKLFAIALDALETDIGEGFGKYMANILNEENVREKKSNAKLEESWGKKRDLLNPESPSNRIKFGGTR